MYQIIPLRVWFVAAMWLTISVFLLIDLGLPGQDQVDTARYAVVVVNALLAALTIKLVWRTIWRWVPPLARWFPDLNGQYEVELRHNWPIQDRMLKAASGGEAFDPRSPECNMPALGTTKLKAIIDMGFYGVSMRMWDGDSDSTETVIDQSRTLSTSLLRPCDGHPFRLVYVYQQKNRRDRRKVTDDSTFEGAAVLNVPSDGSNELKGEYWTNRAWHQGLSTAGIIVLRRTN